MTARRTLEQRGWVNFPVDRPSTNEGGMYVQLVVAPKGEPGRWRGELEWMLCCSSLPQVTLSETLISDGVHEAPPVPEPAEDAPREAWMEFTQRVNAESPAVLFHYPDFPRRAEPAPLGGEAAYRSLDYLAVITLGSTGWSGDWHCTFRDLTPDGKALYAMMQDLYGDRGEVYLMTWLDT